MPLPESEVFNIEFVHTIETHPCLYDNTSLEYRSKDEQDEAWNFIAQKFSSTAMECKMRWKHLRGGLTRYTKKQKELKAQGARPVKQFYLWDVMQFVMPYLKPKVSRGLYLPSSGGNDDQEHDVIKAEFYDDIEADSVDDASREDPETPQHTMRDPTSSSESGRIRKRHRATIADSDDSFERPVPAYMAEKYYARQPNNPDLDFFKSILPDMAAFTPSQKRQFKLGVLQLLEDMSSD